MQSRMGNSARMDLSLLLSPGYLPIFKVARSDILQGSILFLFEIRLPLFSLLALAEAQNSQDNSNILLSTFLGSDNELI